MDEKSILILLDKLKIPHYKKQYTGSTKNTRWIQVTCPFAPYTHARAVDEHPSFGITIKDNKPSAYKCLSCNLKGRLSALPSRLGGYRKQDYSK